MPSTPTGDDPEHGPSAPAVDGKGPTDEPSQQLSVTFTVPPRATGRTVRERPAPGDTPHALEGLDRYQSVRLLGTGAMGEGWS